MSEESKKTNEMETMLAEFQALKAAMAGNAQPHTSSIGGLPTPGIGAPVTAGIGGLTAFAPQQTALPAGVKVEDILVPLDFQMDFGTVTAYYRISGALSPQEITAVIAYLKKTLGYPVRAWVPKGGNGSNGFGNK